MKKFLFIITLAGILLSAQFGFSALINLPGAAAPQTAEGKAAVEKEVKRSGDELASNTGVLTPEAIVKFQDDTTAVVKLSAKTAASSETLTALKADQKDYAIGLGSVRLAQVAITGNTYDFSDTTINPLLFSDTYVAAQTDAFLLQLAEVGPNDIAVIVAMTMTPEEILKLLEARGVPMGNIVIVQAMTEASRTAFGGLFEEYKQGFHLRTIDRNKPEVVRALQGAV